MSTQKDENLDTGWAGTGEAGEGDVREAGEIGEGDPSPPLISIMPVRMSTLAAPNHVEPLSTDEAHAADRVLRRVHEQFRTFLGQLPAEARNASGLARYLDVDRTTCQRLVYIATRPYPGLGIVDRLPGVRGLRQLVEAARSATPPVDDEPLAGLETAINRLDEALRSLGGSQSALLRRLAVTPLSAGDPARTSASDPVAVRHRLFDAAAELTGRYSETWVAVYLYYPAPGSDDHVINVARAHGLIGHLARPNAVPLTFHNFTSKRLDDDSGNGAPRQAFQSLNDGATVGDTPAMVLPEFSTDPPPVVSSRQPGEYLVQAIDAEPSTRGRAIDLMLGTRNTMPHPAQQPPGIEEVWAMINFPVRRMVFDVYLHRDFARECIPSLDVHLWRPDFAAHVGDRWQTRFGDGPRLEVLGQGIGNAATRAYARHAELTSFLYQRLNLDADRFIGYRCAVEYPIWRTGYCMSFDFSSGDEEE